MDLTSPTDPTEELAGSARELVALTPQQQDEFVDLTQLGAPTIVACRRIGTTLEDFVHTELLDKVFRARVALARKYRQENVEAATYKAAIGGSVLAQSTYLRQCRPPEPPREDDVTDKMSSAQLRILMRNSAQEWLEDHQFDENGEWSDDLKRVQES